MEKYVKVGNSGWDCDFGGVVLNPRMCNACKNHKLNSQETDMYCSIKSEDEAKDYRTSKRYDCPDFIPEEDNPWYLLVIEEIKKHTK